MKYNQIDKQKGVAGLEILLSIIATLFMIGIIVMAFVIAGSKLQTAVNTFHTEAFTDNTTTSSAVTELGAYPTGLSVGFDQCSLSLSKVTIATNSTVLLSTDYTLTGCLIKYAGTNIDFNNTNYNVTGSYTFNTATAGDVINDTYTSISTVTQWFPTFIVMGALVVLILLIVIIVRAIRGSGLAGEGSVSGGASEGA